MPFANVNGLDLYYEEHGSPGAPPLLLIPGMGGNHQAWLPLARRLRGLRAVAVDPRDAGKSGRARDFYTIKEMADDIAGVASQLKITPCAVAGFSMGGAIAQELAISHPDVLHRLVLIATYDADDPRGTAIFKQHARLRRILSPEDYHRTLLPWIYTWREYETVIDPEEVIKRFAPHLLAHEPDAVARQARATVTFRSRERLDRIEVPTLLIFGDEDLFTPMRFARSLESGIRGSRLVVLSGAGHGLLFTRTAEVAALVQAFVRE